MKKYVTVEVEMYNTEVEDYTNYDYVQIAEEAVRQLLKNIYINRYTGVEHKNQDKVLITDLKVL